MSEDEVARRIKAIEHPCHDVCVGDLHADCQCAAWVRQEALAALRVTSPGLDVEDVVAAMESILGEGEVSTYDGSMSVDRAARLVYAALSGVPEGAAHDHPVPTPSGAECRPTCPANPQFGVPEGAATRCLCGGTWPCPDRNAPNYRPEAYAEHGPVASGVPEGAASERVGPNRDGLARLIERTYAEWKRTFDVGNEGYGRVVADAILAVTGTEYGGRLPVARPVPSPEPLDVERLLRAMFRQGFGWADIDLADAARDIAREYARLSAPQPVPEDET